MVRADSEIGRLAESHRPPNLGVNEMPSDMIHQKYNQPVELEKMTFNLSDRNPGSLGVHSGRDIHRLKLLEK